MKKQIKKYDKEHLRNLIIYEQQIAKIYESAIKEAAAIGITVGNFNPAKRFKFSDYPITTERINKMINTFASNVQTVVVNGVRSEWTLANNKNNELSRVVFGDKIGKLTNDEYRKLFSNNDKALEAFLKRKKAGLTLSQRVWNNSKNFKDEIELGLGLGIKNGKSANEIAKDLHKYLQNPEAFAKDVSKEFGKAEEIKQRIKRNKRSNQNSLSSAKRLARTETNIAYHSADYERWLNMDFVVGIEISLSGNHTIKTPKGILPLIDICDDLRGKYPKTFKFTGWHPNCRCHATPIMKDPSELFSDKPSKNEVRDVPENFKRWVRENAERAQGFKTQPYFIQDNFVGGRIEGGLKDIITNPNIINKPKPIKTHIETAAQRRARILKAAKKRQAARTPEQVQAIQKVWNERRAITHYSNSILSYMQDINGVDTTKLAELIKSGNIAAMYAEASKLKDIGKTILQFNYLDNPISVARQYGIEVAKNINDSISKKIESLAFLTLEDKKNKIEFEIKWLADNKKYSTWEVAQMGYKKELAKVKYQIAKNKIEVDNQYALNFSKMSKSPKVKQSAKELILLLDKNAELSELEAKAKELNKIVERLESRSSKGLKFDKNAYDQSRKDNAMWAKKTKEADSKLRELCGKLWQTASVEQRHAIYNYTAGSSYINEPLRKMTYSGQYLGVKDGVKDANLISELVSKCSYNFDMWVQRGVSTFAFNHLFGETLTKENMKSLIGKQATEKAFSSCSVTKGKGFKGNVIYNIYCPKNTKCFYCEPFSEYGKGNKLNWDGKTKQETFGNEAELILQKNTTFKITKIEWNEKKSVWFIDLDVINQ